QNDAAANVTLVGTTTLSFNATGTYHIYASAPAFKVNNHKTRLTQLTPVATTRSIGTTEYSGAANDPVDAPNHAAQTRSFIDDIFIITAAPTTMTITHQCLTTRANDGFG